MQVAKRSKRKCGNAGDFDIRLLGPIGVDSLSNLSMYVSIPLTSNRHSKLAPFAHIAAINEQQYTHFYTTFLCVISFFFSISNPCFECPSFAFRHISDGIPPHGKSPRPSRRTHSFPTPRVSCRPARPRVFVPGYGKKWPIGTGFPPNVGRRECGSQKSNPTSPRKSTCPC